MNKSKLGRHLGVGRNYHGEFPAVSLQLPLERLAGHEVRGIVGGTLVGGQCSSVLIDPPVGGLALGDFLASFPRSDLTGTISAVEVPNHERFFAPGHYRLAQMGRPPTGLWLGYYTLLEVWNPSTGAFEGPGGGVGPLFYFVALGTTDSNPVWYDTAIYVSQPWQIHLVAHSNLADANKGYYHLAAQPVHLLDDAPGHS